MRKSASNKNHKNDWSDKQVESHWDRVASIYIAENNKVKGTHDQRFTESIKYLDLPSSGLVLNVTSRDAEAAEYIQKAKPGLKVINAEISSGLIEEARKVRPYVNQVKIETYSDLPFEDRLFDRILTLETLEHVSDPLTFLKELHRVSKENAKMVLSCPPLTSEIPYRIYTFFFGGHGEGPHRFLRSSEVKTMLGKTGWKLIKHKGTLLIPAGPQSIRKAGEKIIQKYQHTFISEFGIRQFYICEKY
jgi:ubiquinone/menaquinone biosynthesis C-methylase UbiE